MPTVNDFYVQARGVAPPQRRWAVGAAYRLAEAVSYGESIASARARILGIPRAYSVGLVSAGLDDEYAAITSTNSPGEPSPAPAFLASDSSWSWFNDPHIVCQRQGTTNWLHVGAVTTNGSVVVRSVNLDTKAIVNATLRAALQVDDHNPPGLLVMPDGTLLATYSRHAVNGDPFYVRRTTDPADPASWGTEATVTSNVTGTRGVTYPRPIRFAGGRIIVFFRGADFSQCLVYSDDNGATWSAAFQLIVNGIQRPYLNLEYNAALDQVDLLYTDAHPRDQNNSMWHATIDSAGNVRTTGGTLIRNVISSATPVTFNEGTQVYAYAAATGKAWGWDIMRDPADTSKVVALFARFPTDDDHRYCYARWNSSAWTTTEFASAGLSIYGVTGAAEPNYSGGIGLVRRDPRIVYASRQDGSAWEMHRYVTDDNGATFTSSALTSGSSAKNVRPTAPRYAGVLTVAPPDMLWMRGTYTAYTDYATEAWASPAITFPPVNLGLPAISGTPQVGQTLTCAIGTWSGTDPISYVYQWRRDGTPIPGATGSTYVAQAADGGTTLDCQVTASNSLGSATATTPGVLIGAVHVVSDSFTDTAGTLLENHTGATGATWTKHSASTTTAQITDAGRIRPSAVSSATALYYASGVPASAEYDVTADFVVMSLVTIFTGITARTDTTANTFYFVRYNQTQGQLWQLYKFVAGTATLLGSFAQTLTVGQTYAVKLQIRDAAKKVFIDGVEQISSVDNAITAAGRAGVRLLDGSASDAGALHLDNFTVVNA